MIPKQDRIKPRTPEDLERMYNFKKTSEKVDKIYDDKQNGVVNAKSGKIGDWLIGQAPEISDLYKGTAIYAVSYSNGVETKVFLTPERVYVTKRTDQETIVDYASWADIIRVVNAAK